MNDVMHEKQIFDSRTRHFDVVVRRIRAAQNDHAAVGMAAQVFHHAVIFEQNNVNLSPKMIEGSRTSRNAT